MNVSENTINPVDHPNLDSGCEESILRHIRQQYLLCKSPPHIQSLAHFLKLGIESSPSNIPTRDHKTISERFGMVYEASVGHLQSEHQPPVQYRIAFVKHIIKQLEKLGSPESAECDKDDGGTGEEQDDNEPSALWYDSLEFLSGMENQTEPFYRWYELSENCGMVKIYENEGAFVAEGTTGLVTWEASIELTRWLCPRRNNEEIRERKWIFELGCGCGLLANSVLKTFPHLSKYIASDGHSSAIVKCKINLEANFGTLNDAIQVEEIDWKKDGRKFEELVRTLSEELGPGILLGADIVFDSELVPALVELIEKFLNQKDSLAFLACTVRNEETLGVLKMNMGTRNLKFMAIHSWGNHEGIIYKISRLIT